jgi:hypothetical protein
VAVCASRRAVHGCRATAATTDLETIAPCPRHDRTRALDSCPRRLRLRTSLEQQLQRRMAIDIRNRGLDRSGQGPRCERRIANGRGKLAPCREAPIAGREELELRALRLDLRFEHVRSVGRAGVVELSCDADGFVGDERGVRPLTRRSSVALRRTAPARS